MNDDCTLIQFEQHSDGECTAAAIISGLIEAGRAPRLVHMVTEGFSQWEQLVALEEALVDNRKNEGWVFVVGRIEGDAETKGWLEYDGWIVLPYGPERKAHGSDIGLWFLSDWKAVPSQIWAATEAADGSGIELNRALKEGFYLGPDECLGES